MSICLFCVVWLWRESFLCSFGMNLFWVVFWLYRLVRVFLCFLFRGKLKICLVIYLLNLLLVFNVMCWNWFVKDNGDDLWIMMVKCFFVIVLCCILLMSELYGKLVLLLMWFLKVKFYGLIVRLLVVWFLCLWVFDMIWLCEYWKLNCGKFEGWVVRWWSCDFRMFENLSRWVY